MVVNHVGHCVADLEASTRFYVEAFGFTVERELAVPDAVAEPFLGVAPPADTRARYLRLGDFTLELLTFLHLQRHDDAPRVFDQAGLTHLSFSVADVAATVEQVRAHGGTVVTEFPGAVIVRDPDGQLLEVLPLSYRERIGQ